MIRLEVRCGRYWRCRFSPFNLRKAAAVCRQYRKIFAKEIHGLRREKLKQYQRFDLLFLPRRNPWRNESAMCLTQILIHFFRFFCHIQIIIDLLKGRSPTLRLIRQQCAYFFEVRKRLAVIRLHFCLHYLLIKLGVSRRNLDDAVLYLCYTSFM